MKITTELLRETALYIQNYFHSNFNADYSFHNYERTLNIVRNCDGLTMSFDMGKQESRLAHLAAWFLEAGYTVDYLNHQAKSAELATAFFNTKGLEKDQIELINEAILSTKAPQQPISLVSQIICDASAYHFAEKDLFYFDAMRNELKVIAKKEFTDLEWLNESISMLANHTYFTKAAKKQFQKRKEKMLINFENYLHLAQTNLEEGDVSLNQALVLKDRIASKVKEDEVKLIRGVESFFRITERRNMELSKMSHEKASLLISVNAIVMSIVLSVLVTKLDENKYLLLPTLFLVISCTVTIIFAIISTRPRILKSDSKGHDVDDHELNLVFFADFTNLSLPQYQKAMAETYKDQKILYDSLSKDIYYQGVILAWKYRYLKIAYNTFMYGFIITIITFIISFALHTS